MTQKQSKRQPTPKLTADPIVPPAAEEPTSPQQTSVQLFEAKRLEEVQHLVKTLKPKLADVTEVLAVHQSRMDKDPADAFENSGSMFTAAARHRVIRMALKPITDDSGNARTLVGDLEPKDSVQFLRKFATDEVLRRARYTEHSSSLTSNLMEREYLAAWSDIIEILNWHTEAR